MVHKNGRGYVVNSKIGLIRIVLKCINQGEFTIALRGNDIKDENNKRVPLWIYYNLFTLNGEKVLQNITPAWHDKPFKYTRKVKDNEEIDILIGWQPHR